jgi:ATP-dependent helicase/nuclease subunit B
LLGHDEVIPTHSAKVGGAPAVASRFLHRLEAVAGEALKSATRGRSRFASPASWTSPRRSTNSAARAKPGARRGR